MPGVRREATMPLLSSIAGLTSCASICGAPYRVAVGTLGEVFDVLFEDGLINVSGVLAASITGEASGDATAFAAGDDCPARLISHATSIIVAAIVASHNITNRQPKKFSNRSFMLCVSLQSPA